MYRYFTHARTLRFVEVLQDLLTSYNNTVHSSIKVAPSQVTLQNESKILKTLYPPKKGGLPLYKFSVGDHVRILQSRLPFQKGYLPAWSEELFLVQERMPTEPPTYRIKDLADEVIEGRFYAEEIQKVSAKESYRVEKVLKTRKRGGKKEYFVKWLGYSNKFNSWVEDIVQ